jgi:hypothetical protein
MSYTIKSRCACVWNICGVAMNGVNGGKGESMVET